MEKIERGEPDRFEVTWKNGHVDYVLAHQVSHTGGERFLFTTPAPKGPERTQFHAEVEGRWTLMLSAPTDELSVIRNVTHVNDVPTGDG